MENVLLVQIIVIFVLTFSLGFFVGMVEGYKICRDEGKENDDNERKDG